MADGSARLRKNGWTPEKCEAFKAAFYELMKHLKISSKEKGDILLGEHLYRAQHRFFDAVFDGLAHGIHDFKHLKSRQLGVCVDPETRVLTADLRWVKIQDVMIGDELVGVDETIPPGKGKARKMRTAIVTGLYDLYAPAYKLTFDDGRSVICTRQHR